MKSYPYFKKEIKEYIERMYPDQGISILDVGAGDGIYSDLLRERYKNIDAVEIYKPNIERYKLESKYKKVYNIDIKDFKYDYYDIIIFGDVIEHLEVEDAQRVLKYACKRCKELIVALPYQYIQGIVDGNEHEIHKQDDLTPSLVLERYPFLELLYGNSEYEYYIKRKS